MGQWSLPPSSFTVSPNSTHKCQTFFFFFLSFLKNRDGATAPQTQAAGSFHSHPLFHAILPSTPSAALTSSSFFSSFSSSSSPRGGGDGTLTIVYPHFWLREESAASVESPLHLVTIPVRKDPRFPNAAVRFHVESCAPTRIDNAAGRSVRVGNTSPTPSHQRRRAFLDCASHFRLGARTGTLEVIRPLDRDSPRGNETWTVVVSATQGSYAK